MKRTIYQKLLDWKQDKYRKPLILRGARQVGKTYILSEFAREYSNSLYVNFERNPSTAAIFADNLEPKELLRRLEAFFGTTITPGNTLIIFDEIQECSNALASLKYFNEEANEYHIVSAGSLLGVKLQEKSGFPVGKVDFLDLKPLSFFEFLDALSEEKLREICENITTFTPLNEALHNKAIALLKQYFIVGGMPEVVARFVAERNFAEARKVQQSILDTYALDFAKHAAPHDIMKIMAIWENIPAQLAKENKKFVFSAINKSARSREYERAIQWLVDAGLIYKVCHITAPKIPLAAYTETNIFKIYLLDIGLLGYMSNLPIKAFLEPQQLFTEFKGALTENFVAQELLANNFDKLYYWSSQSSAEIDFILSHESEIYPLEVKAGASAHKKSLLSYAAKYQAKTLLRATLMNLEKNGMVCNYPLYLVGMIKNLFLL